MKNLLITLLLAAFFLTGCESDSETASSTAHETVSETAESIANDKASVKTTEPVTKNGPPRGAVDSHSFANSDEVEITHLVLDLTVDFDNKQLSGTAEYRLKFLQDDVTELVVDTRDLAIGAVEGKVGNAWEPLTFSRGPEVEHLGSALSIDLKPGVDTVRVRYQSAPTASGLQWLTPAQTAGKKHPFMFSQSQAIHARSWIPVQDSPAVRMTYSATIRTPDDLLAVMSANNEINTPLDGEYYFEMPQAIPAYLIAIGVGDLRFKAMSERTGVYAEPELLDAAVAEFDDTEAMIVVAEELFGPYQWGRYDLLILPPSFPFGGMENPRLSFITPTVIAGDKSLVNLIAHELAHSWSGNLVTNATWNDLWLNEGFTSWVENRIMEEVFGESRAVMEQALAVADLKKELKELPEGDQKLAINLEGRDPDDSFSGVPYVKGQMFLMALEEHYGREVFDPFVRTYFTEHAFESLTTAEFEKYLLEHLVNKYQVADKPVVDSEWVSQWIHEPGLPASAPAPVSDRFDRVDQQLKSWLDGTITAADIDTANWTIHEWLHFLNALPASINVAQLKALDDAFDLTESTNNEVAHAWLLIGINQEYTAIDSRLDDYLISIGRRKLIVPLYEALAETAQGKARAVTIYEQARPGYHPLAQSTIDKILL